MNRNAVVSICRLAGQRKPCIALPTIARRALSTFCFVSDRQTLPVRRLPTISSCSRSFPTIASFSPFCKWYSLDIPSSDKSQEPKEDTVNNDKTRSEQNSKSSRNSNESGSRQSLGCFKRLFYALGTVYFLNDIHKEKGEKLLSIWSGIEAMKGLFENILGLWGYMEKSLEKGFNKTFLEWVNKCKGKSDLEAYEKIMIREEIEKAMKKREAEAKIMIREEIEKAMKKGEAEAEAEASKTTGWWGQTKYWFGH